MQGYYRIEVGMNNFFIGLSDSLVSFIILLSLFNTIKGMDVL